MGIYVPGGFLYGFPTLLDGKKTKDFNCAPFIIIIIFFVLCWDLVELMKHDFMNFC